jgi:hypothetical protein
LYGSLAQILESSLCLWRIQTFLPSLSNHKPSALSPAEIKTVAPTVTEPTKEKPFFRELSLLLFAALFGFLPAFTLTVYQAKFQLENQRKEFLYEKRVSALKDFAAALSADGSILDKFNRVDRDLALLLTHPSEEGEVKFFELYSDLSAEEEKYGSNVRLEIIVLASLFHDYNPPIKPTLIPDFNAPMKSVPQSFLSEKDRMNAVMRSLKKAQDPVNKVHALFLQQRAAYVNYYESMARQLDSK